MRSITEAGDLNGKKVLVRVDWNVPVRDGIITDTFRIEKSLATLQYLKEAGAQVTVATHLESGGIEALKTYVPEGAVLLPNLRENPGEEGNAPEFAQELASKADIYVNEAFSVSHRNHASIVGVPKLIPAYAGLRFEEEVRELSKAFSPEKPFLFILGGAKFETKIPLVEKFLNIADTIFIAGANAKPAFETHLKGKPKIIFPVGDLAALDADEEVIVQMAEEIAKANFILWNGPLGKYEDGLKEGTLKLAQLIASSGKKSLVGGGDTLAAIGELGLFDKFSFVSTGGGAMLDFLATETLPGIEALGHSPMGETFK